MKIYILAWSRWKNHADALVFQLIILVRASYMFCVLIAVGNLGFADAYHRSKLLRHEGECEKCF
jgi:hypothetical protein